MLPGDLRVKPETEKFLKSASMSDNQSPDIKAAEG